MSGSDQANLNVCPICQNSNWKFYMCIGGPKDGLWDCKVCSEAGNIHKLMSAVGDRMDGIISMRDAAVLGRAPEPLPDIGAAHRRLMEDEETLDYLIGTRGFSTSVVEKFQLGVELSGGVKWLLIPYVYNGSVVFVKYRSLPPAGKAFRSLAGRDAPLYNEECLKPDMDEILFVEGEADALSCLSTGIEAVVGVPGANLKKLAWIKKLDELQPKKIYILYDNDKVGQRAAKEIASRIGLEKCFNILLPPFKTVDDKDGKDINEWFRSGHTLEDFDILKQQARPFDVDGVSSLATVLAEMEEELEGRGSLEPALKTPWPKLNEKLGGCEFGDLVGIIAEGKVGKTTLALNWLEHYAALGMNTFMFCLEMPPKRLARKWVSHITNTNDTPGHSNMTVQTVREAKVIAGNREGDILFGYCRANKRQEVFEIIRQTVRRYGVKVVCFDNLQFLCRSIDHSAQEMGVISKEFKELATELNILILLIVQPNRVREGEIVAARNASGSSAIEKDVDAMIALHRNRIGKIKADDFQNYMEVDDNFEPQMLVRVDLSRYAPGGVVTLWMDGATSTVREFTEQEFNNVPKAHFGDSLPVEERVAV
jgi:twinkle protein